MSIEPETNNVGSSSTTPLDPTPPPDFESPPIESATVAEHPTVTDRATPALPAQPIVARYGQYYRNTRYIMTAVTIVMGFWFLYDGFVRYPAENAKIDALNKQRDAAQSQMDEAELARVGTELKAHTYHSGTDLLIQRLLAFGLPPAGLLLLMWAMYNSRGEYRLADDILHVPGHPPVPLASIRELDETMWDRKGIALLKYTLDHGATGGPSGAANGGQPGGQSGKIKLDDFVYDRVPTDKIYDSLRASMQAPADGGSATTL